jgi:predicted DCC family thiol-disulfide oxidoreductase YuxK
MRARYTRCNSAVVASFTFTCMKDARCIVFFDGVCNLCNSMVNGLIARNGRGRLKFASLQGLTAASLLPIEKREQIHSVLYYRRGRIYEKSAALVHILADLAWYGWLAKPLLLVPLFIRDGIYDWVAANRYKWFGKKTSCRVPATEERLYLLD